MDSHRITLATKPGASLAVRTYRPDDPAKLPAPLSTTLIVFLNGLASPQSSWNAAIDLLLQHRPSSTPALLTYDRYGQGESDSDPSDPPDTPYGHGAAAVIDDLHQLITQTRHDTARLVLVCNSIGCALVRLYAACHPRTVAAFLFLDSIMANSDLVSVFSDPAGASPGDLPDGVSPDDLRHAREQYRARFHPAAPNTERLDRRDLPLRLPLAYGPVLPPGPDGRPPVVTVVGHDFEKFAQDGLEVCACVFGVLSLAVGFTV